MIISIHALREEGDPAPAPPALPPHNFYPRPPRGGRRDLRKVADGKPKGFLSTPSARRATLQKQPLHLCGSISIHALREEGDEEAEPADVEADDISIHALREEGDRAMTTSGVRLS